MSTPIVRESLTPLLEHLDHDCISEITNALDNLHMNHITLSDNAYLINDTTIEFPKTDPDNLININMMPFKLFDIKKSLPSYLHKYIDVIYSLPLHIIAASLEMKNKQKKNYSTKEHIAYLTIHESIMIHDGKSQRRDGLHIERPGRIKTNNGGYTVNFENTKLINYFNRNIKYDQLSVQEKEYLEIRWGGGVMIGSKFPIDGIWFCSNIAETSAVYPVLIKNPKEITTAHGGIELMRPILDKMCTKKLLKANELCWITDCTPHESLPLPAKNIKNNEPIIRQFFRVVVGDITVWYSQHNTANPLGILPNAIITDESKF
jgi:hypothetical protein